MARRQDTENILDALDRAQRALDDPATGLAALYKEQAELRRKILETVTFGTTGLREENRELRRRQEKMIGDLAETRTAVETLRRELAQAWAHTVRTPNPAATPGAVAVEYEPRQLEASQSIGWKEETVQEPTDPAEYSADSGEEAPAQIPAPTTPDAPPVGEQAPQYLPPTRGSDADPAREEVEEVGQPAGKSPLAERDLQADARAFEGALQAAASIGSTRLVCHRDTWEFVIGQTSTHKHFRTPGRISDLGEGQIEAYLSGRSLLAVLAAMRETYRGRDVDMATWALAFAVYQRTLDAVEAARRDVGSSGALTTIVLDDRAGSDAA